MALRIARGLRNEVRALGVRPELLLGLMVLDGAFARAGADCIVTGLIEGSHSRASLHYVGLAVDVRITHVPKEKLPGVLTDARGALGVEYDLVEESDHWHLEWQPKDPLDLR